MQKWNQKSVAYSLGAIACILVCSLFLTCKSDFDKVIYTAGDANVQRVVAVGGNYLSGYQDGALFSEGQAKSVPALMAEQFKAVGGGAFLQPTISDMTGIGLTLKSWGTPYQQRATLIHFTDCLGEKSLFPSQDLLSVSAAGTYLSHVSYVNYNNMSVPFATSKDIVNPNFGSTTSGGNTNPYFTRFALSPGVASVLDDAKKIDPTFFIVWVGMEDIYNYALRGAAEGSITPVADFSANLDKILSTLTSSGSRGVLANIPNLKAFPVFTTVSPRALKLDAALADTFQLHWPDLGMVEGDNGFVIHDASLPFPSRQMTADELVLLTVPLDSVKCNKLGSLLEMPNRYALDKKEIETIEYQISQYNLEIAAKASKYNVALVDMNAYFDKLKTGIASRGEHFTNEFVKGGFYSLDGYHPTEKGYGLLANEFIKTMNNSFKATIPTTLCKDCKGVRFP